MEKELKVKTLSVEKVLNLDFPIDVSPEIVSSDFFGNTNERLQAYVQALSDERIRYLTENRIFKKRKK